MRWIWVCVCASIAFFFQQAPAFADPWLDADVARAQRLVSKMSALTPQTIQELSREEATVLWSEWAEINIALPHRIIASGVPVDKVGEFFRTHGIAGMISPPVQRTSELLASRADPAEVARVDLELEGKYPAYANYKKRTRISNVLKRLEKPARAAAPQRAAQLQEVSASAGVRSASYADDKFSVVFDDKIVSGGVLELTSVRLPDGRVDWRCTTSESIRQFAPQQCR